LKTTYTLYFAVLGIAVGAVLPFVRERPRKARQRRIRDRVSLALRQLSSKNLNQSAGDSFRPAFIGAF
jgi:type II secretory pathway pseudopilin PulG